MLPLKDENPTTSTPVVTILLIAACIVVYFFVQPTGQASLRPQSATDESRREILFNLEHAAVPCEVVRGRPLSQGEVDATYRQGDTTACQADPTTPPLDPRKNVYLAIFYSMFLHGNLLHIAGNMWFLWVFGNNIEDRMGKVGFVVFYLAGGLAAALAHIFVEPTSTLPVVGASGAIAAVMGAYLVLFPNAPVRTLIIFYVILFRDIPAKWLLGLWLASQFFVNPSSAVAWMAHVGGFVFGMIVALLLRDRLRPPSSLQWRY